MVAICEAFRAYFSQALSVSRTALLGGRDLLVGLSGVSCIKAKQPLILFPSLKRNQRDSLYFGVWRTKRVTSVSTIMHCPVALAQRRYCHRGRHVVPCSGGLSQWAVGLEMSGRRWHNLLPPVDHTDPKDLALCVWAPPRHLLARPAVLTSRVYKGGGLLS